MKFLAFTLVKLKNKDGTEKDHSKAPIKIRYNIDRIDFYHEYNGTNCAACVWLKDGDKMYCKETIEELDLILNGANGKTVGVLYGNE